MTLAEFLSWLNIEIAVREAQRLAITREDGFGQQIRDTHSAEIKMLLMVLARAQLMKKEEPVKGA